MIFFFKYLQTKLAEIYKSHFSRLELSRCNFPNLSQGLFPQIAIKRPGLWCLPWAVNRSILWKSMLKWRDMLQLAWGHCHLDLRAVRCIQNDLDKLLDTRKREKILKMSFKTIHLLQHRTLSNSNSIKPKQPVSNSKAVKVSCCWQVIFLWHAKY